MKIGNWKEDFMLQEVVTFRNFPFLFFFESFTKRNYRVYIMAVDLCDQFPKLPFGNLLIYIPSQDNFDTKQKQTPKLTGS